MYVYPRRIEQDARNSVANQQDQASSSSAEESNILEL